MHAKCQKHKSHGFTGANPRNHIHQTIATTSTITLLLVFLAHQGNSGRSLPSSFYFDFMNDLNGGSEEHGETGFGHGSSAGVNWDYNWGWGSSPRTGWGYGSGSAEGPSGSWKASGFGFGTGTGTGTGSGSGYGYGTGTNDGGGGGGGHGGAYGYGSGSGSGSKDGGNGGGGGEFHDPEKPSIPQPENEMHIACLVEDYLIVAHESKSGGGRTNRSRVLR